MTSIEDKFSLLYNQAQSGKKMIQKLEILHTMYYDKIHTKFLKMIIGVSKYTGCQQKKIVNR